MQQSNPTPPTTTLVDFSGVLRKAAAILDDNGLYQGMFVAPWPPTRPLGERAVCTAGALNLAHCGDPERMDDFTEQVVEFVARRLPTQALPPHDEVTRQTDWLEHLASWNDQPGRTAGEVVEVLRGIADGGLVAR